MMKKTPLKRTKRINKKSKRRAEEESTYFSLVAKLRDLCKNRSELSGRWANWESHWDVEPHHIEGRIGSNYTNPFKIIMLTRPEHDAEEGIKRFWPYLEKPVKHTKEELLAIVRPIRIKQGFKESDYV